MEGILRRDSRAGAVGAEQTYTRARTGDRHTRHGFFCRVRVTDYGPGH